MDFVLIVLGILALAAFNRLFMPSMNAWGRPPLIQELMAYAAGMAQGIESAKRMEETFRKQQEYDHQQNAAQGGEE